QRQFRSELQCRARALAGRKDAEVTTRRDVHREEPHNVWQPIWFPRVVREAMSRQVERKHICVQRCGKCCWQAEPCIEVGRRVMEERLRAPRALPATAAERLILR